MPSKTKLYWIVGTLVVVGIVVFGFYEKYRKEALYKEFLSGKALQCGDTVVQKSRGWKIKSNRFFTNGKVMKTIVFCESIK